MTLHFHGTPITPKRILHGLAGRNFCVSYADARDVEVCHRLGQSVMLDNGAFTAWKTGRPAEWHGYYRWAENWLDYPTTWAVVPDVIDAPAELQDELLRQWPHGTRGAPVWHLHEPVARLVMLLDEWPRVCMGSSGEYAVIGAPSWHRRIAEAWDAI